MSTTAPEEFERYLSGAGAFVGDLTAKDILYGHVIRSPHAHAEIGQININPVLSSPGVRAVFTAADLEAAEVGSIPCLWTVEQYDGSPAATPPNTILAKDKVRHVGDAVAFLVAESSELAADAAERVEIDYRPLPSVTNAREALSSDAPLIWDEVQGNRCFHCEFGDDEETDAAFGRAAKIVQRSFRFPRVLANTIETRGAFCVPEEHGVTLYIQSQGAQFARRLIAQVLGWEIEQIRVVTPDVGGAFGMKAFIYPEQVLTALAAKKLGKPVKWEANRSYDGFTGDNHARDLYYDVSLALDDNGLMLGLRMETVANLGAYLSSFVMGNSTLPDRMIGPYDLPAAHVIVKGAFTNTTPIDSYRGASRAEAVFPMERVLDAAARELRIDPAELRRRNFAQSDQKMRTNCLGLAIEHKDYQHCLDEALSRFDWSNCAEGRAHAQAKGMLYGVGLACYATTTMPAREEVRLQVDRSGLVTVFVGTQSSGQGHEHTFSRVIAEALSIEPGQIRFHQGDTREFEFEGLTGGSHTTAGVTPPCTKAALALIARGKKIVASLLQTKAEQISYANGVFHDDAQANQFTLGEVAVAAFDADFMEEGELEDFSAVGESSSDNETYPSGTHIAEVLIELETGNLSLVRYLSVDDFGRVLAPHLAVGQVHGAVAQGFGQAVTECCLYEHQSGQLMTGSFLDYAMPRAADLPFIEANFANWDEDSPIRGLGEMATIAATPAIMNAISDALASIGVAEIEPPASPERLWRACQKTDVNHPQLATSGSS